MKNAFSTVLAAATRPIPALAVGHVPPHNAALEAAVLGALLLEADALRTVLGILPSEKAFYVPAHRFIFRAVRTLFAAGQAIDQLTLTVQLRADGVLERVGGPHFVAGLTMKINSAAHIESHCRLVQEYQARRQLITTSTRLMQHAYDEGEDALGLLTAAQLELNGLHKGLESKAVQTAASTYDGVFADLVKAVESPDLTGVSTGLRALNDVSAGWQDSDLIVLAARPGMGKTAALLHFARTCALDLGRAAAIFSMEMPTKQLMQRMVASEVPGYSNADLRRGNIAGGVPQVHQLYEAAKRLRTDKLLIDDTPGLSIFQLRAKAARLKAEHGVALILVDYIQLMKGETKGNREQEIGSITRGLKELAKELDVPVIALSQLSRSVETRGGDKRPQLSDLRESGSLEQDADMVVMLWRGEYYGIEEYSDGTPTQDTILFDICKHRNGALGEVIAGCSMKRGTFFDLGEGNTEAYEIEVGPRMVRLGALPTSQFEDPANLPF
ncbi:replicative DNA helicase [Hymenobacter nivis]|nr:replicative DNA helicase [Hymenobacter nivis]